MSKTNNYIIQLNATMLLLGYWFMHAMTILVTGHSSRSVSIFYDGLQLALSLYVLFICRKDFFIERGRSLLSFYSIILVLYTIRMLYDSAFGPFVGKIPNSWFINDFLLTVVSTFVTVWSIITSRKCINVKVIINIVFWIGLITIITVIINQLRQGLILTYEEERMDGGQGLGTLALVKLAAIVILAALHLIMNQSHDVLLKIVYYLSLCLGFWLLLASGSRGGVAGLVIAIGIYLLASSRRNVLLVALFVTLIILAVINIVPILTWLSDYFPVFGNRMISTIIENDQGSRQMIRSDAIRVSLEHPLFGYSYRLYPTENGFRAHNGILEVFIALGIPVGLSFIVFTFIKSLIMSVQKMIDKRFFFPSVLAVFALTSSMSSSSVSDNVFGFAICLLGCAYYYKRV